MMQKARQILEGHATLIKQCTAKNGDPHCLPNIDLSKMAWPELASGGNLLMCDHDTTRSYASSPSEAEIWMIVESRSESQ